MRIGRASRDNAYGWISISNAYKILANKNSVVLEIGASSEANTKYYARFCKKLYGLEYLKDRTPKNNHNITYITGDWQKLSSYFPQNYFDIAVSNHTLEHIQNDLRAINELYKVLKPGGAALINTPNKTRLLNYLKTLIYEDKTYLERHEHVREYSGEELKKLLQKSKFKKYNILAVSFGLHAGPFYFHSDHAPGLLRKYANFWEVRLYK